MRRRSIVRWMHSITHKASSLYVVAILVLVASAWSASNITVKNLSKALFAVPGATALFSIVYRFWKDERAHERQVEIQARQQEFAFLPASRMASVAYDKHVKFCEEYLEAVNKAVFELWAEGPNVKALGHANSLRDIRDRHTAWLTREIEEKLFPIEAALRKIGAGSHVLPLVQPGLERSKIVDDVYGAFGKITESGKENQGSTAAVALITDSLRELLGIKELTELRTEVTKLARDRLCN
jgi:hypothetical protein